VEKIINQSYKAPNTSISPIMGIHPTIKTSKEHRLPSILAIGVD